jgi:Ser/Thr protein kinase RdoA (MazF antagonist)
VEEKELNAAPVGEKLTGGPVGAEPLNSGPAEEELLTGGNVAGRVVRAGYTVRKPAGPATRAISALLDHLATAGFDGAPRNLGTDAEGRHVLEYIPGPMAHDLPPLGLDGLRRVGRLIRRLHDAAQSFEPPPGAQWDVAIPPDRRELICHHDLAPWNLVCGPDRWVFIDWDGAGPGSRLWDLGYAVTGFIPLAPGGDPATDGPRMRALADGYGLNAGQRRELPALAAAHTRGMYELLRDGAVTGTQPWARLHAEGHAEFWGPAADYIERHHGDWLAFLI